ncbi:mucin-3A isoform X3 [Oncorhynchus tshawytscha]|uniref:mucin-3A isoform X3 n=1 Tax=Oncorhynchus tshawytscha TaxID=74940 RepID=UPI001C3E4E2D|nr:mucin-3A isoform X3 [Oncorhynchus tshawytscha]
MILFIPDMAGRLFLLILLFDTFQFLKAKDLPQPSLTVIPAVIKERDSVQLNCQTPPPVFECYFKIEGKVEFTLSSPCQQTLTGTLLVRWTGQSSPAEVKIQCQYSAKGSQFRSIYSEPSTVTITDLPQLTVSSTVIRETESVQLSCETPPSLPVSHCYFNIEGGENPPDSSCTQTITGTELLKRSGPTFPAVVKVTCYYTVWKSHTSPFSDPVSVTVQDPKPDITVHFDEDFNIICLIPGSVSPDTTCNLYVGEESQPSFTAKIMKRKATSASKQWFCQFTPKHSDLISRLQSVRRKEVSCDYRLSSGPNSLSPRSDGYSFTDLVGVHISDSTTIQTPSIAVSLTPGPRSTLPPSTTASPTEDTTVTPSTSLTSPLTPSRAVNPSSDPMMCFASGSTVCSTLTTDTPASPTERGQSSTESEVESNSQESILLGQLWQAAVGVASGMGVFLVGLTAVCLCRRTKKTNSQRPTARQDDHRQYDLVSMGAVSSGVMVDSGDAGNDSQITSVLSMFMPSGPVDVDTQAFANEHSDTYHIYSSIPDRPASSAQSDGLYSLLQTH